MNKGIAPIVIILIIIGVLALGGGAWYYQQQREMEKLQKQAEELAQPIQSPQPEQEKFSPQDETANWKTYKTEYTGLDNKSHEFEFKYPLEWIITSNPILSKWDPDLGIFALDMADKECYDEYIKSGEPTFKFFDCPQSFTIYLLRKNFEGTEQLLENIKKIEDSKGTEKIEGLNGVEYIKHEYELSSTEIRSASLIMGGDIFSISYNCKFNVNFCSNIFNQILSTFRFIE